MTNQERIKARSDTVNYIISNHLEGVFVECGVWKGGSILAIIRVLLSKNVTNIDINLFDTFKGISKPTEYDIDINGDYAQDRLQKESTDSWVHAKSALEEVKHNISKLNYSQQYIHYIKGKVEDTLPSHKPDKIALLRLDTDWYESTKIELNELYDNVVTGGIIIIDDYAHWQGCRKAVDEFIQQRDERIFLSRIDYTGRLIVKP
ncbi:TylF/MycF/NovP-related O-methyltransferase [Thermodesulfobacteriota bacterium]